MHNLFQNLYITYSNQKARDLKAGSLTKPLDKVITLDALLLELYESNNFTIIIDSVIGSSIILDIIKQKNIEYFSYLSDGAVSLQTIYDFIVKCHRNDVGFDAILKGEKLQAMQSIDDAYQAYKQLNNLADISDIEESVLQNFESYFKNSYETIYVDDFTVEDISFIKSKKQENILAKLSHVEKIHVKKETATTPKLITPSSEVFDTIDEIKTALRISRKLLEEGAQAEDILIVASDIQEYSPLYALFLDEYALKGYSSLGTPLTAYGNSNDTNVQRAQKGYESQIASLDALYSKLGLTLSKNSKQNIKASIKVQDKKIGLELTEANQVVGLSKRYKHIIFIGTDINHFPPKTSDNFLYSYEDDLDHFYANNFFTSSQTQLNELKRLSENLYIITASYSGKRELTPSILIDKNFDETIDIEDVKSVSQLAFVKETSVPDESTKNYYKSIINEDFTPYDGLDVQNIDANHLSASQINKYLSCPLAYLYNNKLKVGSPGQSEEGFDVMQQGTLMHLCYELFGKKIKAKSITSTDQETLYKIMYEVSKEAYVHKDTVEPRGKPKLQENIHHQIFLSTLQAGLQDDRALGLLAKFVDYYIANAKTFNYFKDTKFEKEFALDKELKPYVLKDEKDTNYFIKGFIDRFDNLGENINIVDYKSKKVSSVDKNKQKEVEDQKDIQLALYILYARQAYPNKTYDAHLLSFKGNDKGVKFASLSNDIYDDAYDEKLKKLIFDTKDNIEKGKFMFDNSDEKMCEWCDVKYICHAGVLNKNKKKD